MRVRLHRYLGWLGSAALIGTAACTADATRDDPGDGDDASVVDEPNSRTGNVRPSDMSAIARPSREVSSRLPSAVDVGQFCAGVETTGFLASRSRSLADRKKLASTFEGRSNDDLMRFVHERGKDLGISTGRGRNLSTSNIGRNVGAHSNASANRGVATRSIQPRATRSNPGAVTNDELAAIMITLNQGEIDQARYAESHASDEAVRGFVKELIADHTQALDQIKAELGAWVIPSQESKLNTSLREQDDKDLMLLQATCGPEFDQAFIAEQLRAHVAVLNVMDRLLMQTQNTDLQCTLAELRSVVFQHYERALEIHVSMAGEQAGEPGGNPVREEGGSRVSLEGDQAGNQVRERGNPSGLGADQGARVESAGCGQPSSAELGGGERGGEQDVGGGSASD